ncbi:MAG: hypothetical protein V4489_01535 [Chlamydiota bacterium]
MFKDCAVFRIKDSNSNVIIQVISTDVTKVTPLENILAEKLTIYKNELKSLKLDENLLATDPIPTILNDIRIPIEDRIKIGTDCIGALRVLTDKKEKWTTIQTAIGKVYDSKNPSKSLANLIKNIFESTFENRVDISLHSIYTKGEYPERLESLGFSFLNQGSTTVDVKLPKGWTLSPSNEIKDKEGQLFATLTPDRILDITNSSYPQAFSLKG